MAETVEIKIRMLRLGLSQAELARRVKAGFRVVSMVINGDKMSRPVMTRIAAELGMEAREIFPELERSRSRKSTKDTNERTKGHE